MAVDLDSSLVDVDVGDYSIAFIQSMAHSRFGVCKKEKKISWFSERVLEGQRSDNGSASDSRSSSRNGHLFTLFLRLLSTVMDTLRENCEDNLINVEKSSRDRMVGGCQEHITSRHVTLLFNPPFDNIRCLGSDCEYSLASHCE